MTDTADTDGTPSTDADTGLDDLNPDQDSFPREYVQKLREEAAQHRVRANEAESKLSEYQVFEQYPEQDREVWKNLAASWLESPEQSAQYMQQIASNVLSDPNATDQEKAQAVTDAQEVAAAEANPNISTEDVEKLVQEKLDARDQKAKIDAQVNAVHDKIADAGFPRGSVDNFAILWMANNDKSLNGDLDKAIEAWRARLGGERQGAIDGYLSDVQKNAVTTMPSTGAGATETPAAPRRGHEMEDARKQADAWLDAQRRAQ